MASGDINRVDPREFWQMPGGDNSEGAPFFDDDGIADAEFVDPDEFSGAEYGDPLSGAGQRPPEPDQEGGIGGPTTREAYEAGHHPPVRTDIASEFYYDDWVEIATTPTSIEDWFIFNQGAQPIIDGKPVELYEDHATPTPSLVQDHTESMPSASLDQVRQLDEMHELCHGKQNLIIGRESDTYIHTYDPSLPPVEGSPFNSREVWSLVDAERGPGYLTITDWVSQARENGRYTQYAARDGRQIESMIIGTFEDIPMAGHEGTPHELAAEGYPYDEMFAKRAGIFLTSAGQTTDYLFVKLHPSPYPGNPPYREFGLMSSTYKVIDERDGLSKLEKDAIKLGSLLGIPDGLLGVQQAVAEALDGWRVEMAELENARVGERYERIQQAGLASTSDFGAKLMRHFSQQTRGMNKFWRERDINRAVNQIATLDEQYDMCMDVRGGNIDPYDDMRMIQRRDTIYSDLLMGILMQTKIAALDTAQRNRLNSRSKRQISTTNLVEFNSFSIEDYKYFNNLGKIRAGSFERSAQHWHKEYGSNPNNAHLQLVAGPPLGPDGLPVHGNVYVTYDGLHLDPDNLEHARYFSEGHIIRYGVSKGMPFISPGSRPITDKAVALRVDMPHMLAGGIASMVIKSEKHGIKQKIDFWDMLQFQASGIRTLHNADPLLNPNGPLEYTPRFSDLMRLSRQRERYMIRTAREVINISGKRAVQEKSTLEGTFKDGQHFAFVRSSDYTQVGTIPTERLTLWQQYMWERGLSEDDQPPDNFSAGTIADMKSRYCTQYDPQLLPDPDADVRSVALDFGVVFYERNDDLEGFTTMVMPNQPPETYNMAQRELEQ